MEFLLLVIFIILELGLSVITIFSQKERKCWLFNRFMVSSGELIIYLFMILFPGIDFTFRFKGLFFVLLIRVFVTGICYFVKLKKAEGNKKIAGAIMSAVTGIALISISMIPAFIFTGYNGMDTSGEHPVAEASVILVDESRVEAFEQDGSKREVPTHFFYPADADGTTKYPLVIFSHGAFGYYQSNMSTYQELASNGYVVISLDHPYHSFFTNDTSGKLITVDPQFINNVLTANNETTSEEEIFEISKSWMELRCTDVNFVLDTVKAAATDNKLNDFWYVNNKNASELSDKEKSEVLYVLSLINCDKIGLMGHSMGGSASVSVGRQRNDISAVIDLDGTMLGEEKGYENGEYIFYNEPYPVPVLSIDNEEHHVEGERLGSYYVNNAVINNALDGYNTYFKASGHMNFTDLPLFSPVLAKNLGTGSIDSEHCIRIMNDIVLQFMNQNLKSEGTISLQEYYE